MGGGASRLGSFDKHQRRLHQRIEQALVVHPLASQNNHDCDHDQIENAEEDAPCQQRHDPSVPRDATGTDRVAFVEVLHGFRIQHQQVLGHVSKEQFSPFVFGCRIVLGARQIAEQKAGESHGWQRCRHEGHDVDDGYVCRAQGPGATQARQDRVEQQREEKQRHQRRGGGKVESEIAAPDRVVRIDNASADDAAADSSDEEPLGGDRGRCQCTLGRGDVRR
jgi:hypothetical protein